jgi:hypothetical protein
MGRTSELPFVFKGLNRLDLGSLLVACNASPHKYLAYVRATHTTGDQRLLPKKHTTQTQQQGTFHTNTSPLLQV